MTIMNPHVERQSRQDAAYSSEPEQKQSRRWTKFALTTLVAIAIAPWSVAQEAAEDPWGPLRQLEGRWEGEISGRLGSGSGVREYEFILDGQYLVLRHASIRMPQELSPDGDHHQELAIFSYDSERKKIVLREFMIEGVVPQSLCDVSETRVICTSEHVESGPGIRALLSIEFESPYMFTDTYQLAFPDDETLQLYFTNRWTKLPALDL